MTSDLVTLDWYGDVAVLAMSRPAKGNAFNAQMNAEFGGHQYDFIPKRPAGFAAWSTDPIRKLQA